MVFHTGSSLLSPSNEIMRILLSNRYLIYTLTNHPNYIIYDFRKKQLLLDRPLITTLLNSKNERIVPDCQLPYIGHGEDKLLLYSNYICNLWDIERDRVYCVQFQVSSSSSKEAYCFRNTLRFHNDILDPDIYIFILYIQKQQYRDIANIYLFIFPSSLFFVLSSCSLP